jgi:Anabaena sensory rhodopsin transducer
MTMDAIGRKRWAIAEGHIPSQSSFTDRDLISHETACILNAGDGDALVALTIFFADRDPVGPYRITSPVLLLVVTGAAVLPCYRPTLGRVRNRKRPGAAK